MSLGRSKECKYQCGTVLAWDDEEKYFVEVENNNAQHTRERCEWLRGPTKAAPQQARTEVKQAVNQDLQMAILQELRRANGYLAKISGEEQ
jgi:hypothetical protein